MNQMDYLVNLLEKSDRCQLCNLNHNFMMTCKAAADEAHDYAIDLDIKRGKEEKHCD